jgi:hypothetical protein
MIIAQELEDQQNISQDVIFLPSDLYSDEFPHLKKQQNTKLKE